jgi:hypothetical protein
MANVAAQGEPALVPVLEELRRLEPIFHTREFGTTLEDAERRMAPDYFEVGASGRRYSRAFVLATLQGTAREEAGAATWMCADFGLRRLGEATYLLTYTLREEERVTRRATVWRKAPEGWQILYHQGTIATGVEDDTLPAEPPRARP